MPRNPVIEIQQAMLAAQLLATGEDAPPIEEKLRLLDAFRGQSADAAARIDRALLENLSKMHTGLAEAHSSQEKLRELLDKLTRPPWHPGVFLGLAETERGEAALVLHGTTRSVVGLADGFDPESVDVGDEVLLTAESNVVLAKSPYRATACGETALFDRLMPDGRLVLKSRDDEIVVDPSGALRRLQLKAGDEVRFDRSAWIAYEKVERSKGGNYFLEETPATTFQEIGGLDRQIEELQQSLRLHFYHAETTRRYRLPRKKAVLLFGPAGTGKTLTARALANWLACLSSSGRSRFINVKPAGLHSMWYGQTEANYREVFRVAREAGELEPEVPVVIFFDEVDAIGTVRGSSVHRVDDKVLNAFMSELNGLEDRGNVLVVTATNRIDTLDPALTRPGRLGDLILKIPRPNRAAAREIFRRHLHPDIPYASNGHSPCAEREMLIDAAVSQIYSPNGDGKLATITFRDGKRQTVSARELVNGAEIAKIAQTAVERACLREALHGAGGVALEDVMAGVAGFFESATQGLTPGSCAQRIDDLPRDLDVVRVEPVERKVRRSHNYLNAA